MSTQQKHVGSTATNSRTSLSKKSKSKLPMLRVWHRRKPARRGQHHTRRPHDGVNTARHTTASPNSMHYIIRVALRLTFAVFCDSVDAAVGTQTRGHDRARQVLQTVHNLPPSPGTMRPGWTVHRRCCTLMATGADDGSRGTCMSPSMDSLGCFDGRRGSSCIGEHDAAVSGLQCLNAFFFQIKAWRCARHTGFDHHDGSHAA